MSPFPLTTQVLRENEWTVAVVESRQRQLLRTLTAMWRVKVPLPLNEPSVNAIDNLIEDVDERATFHAEIIPRLAKHFGKTLSKRGGVVWASDDASVVVSCQASRRFDRSDQHYWFGLKRSTKEILERDSNAFSAFGLGTPQKVVLLPYTLLAENLQHFYTSPDGHGGVLHWHIRFREHEGRLYLLVSPDHDSIDVSPHLLKG